MASFSERIGVQTPRTSFQLTSLEKETRVALWNTMLEFRDDFDYRELARPSGNDPFVLTEKLWTDFFRKPHDELNQLYRVWNLMKHHTLTAAWNEVLDLVESFAQYLYLHDNDMFDDSSAQWLIEQFNAIFAREMVGYRFIGTEITPITEKRDVEAVEEALNQLLPYSGARQHLEQAVESLADRTNPNYAHSISESVKAVEGVVQKLTNTKASLGDGLIKLEKSGLEIHPALKEAWRKMYGWVSNDKGIRHATNEAATVDQSLAKYMLISCSAFVSYLIEEASKKDFLQ